MIPYNCTLLDALRYHRGLVTDDDIIVEVERLNSIVVVVEDKIDFDSPEELAVILDQRDEDLHRFYEEVVEAYEIKHNTDCANADPDSFSEMVCEAIKSEPDSNSLVIQGVDLELLEQQRQILGRLDRSTLSAEELEALTGVLNMLDSWSDKR